MKKLNLKIRKENIAFVLGLLGVGLSPIMAYYGASLEDFTTWGSIGEMLINVVQNPFVLGSVVFAVMGALGVFVDPTTKGVGDSERALNYEHLGE